LDQQGPIAVPPAHTDQEHRMRSTAASHQAHPWRVHTLAPDFELIDVWSFDVQVEPGRSFDAFLGVFWDVMGTLARHPLSRLRMALGRGLGWDKKPDTRSIPGCRERRLAERLEDGDRAKDRTPAGDPPRLASVRPVYRFADEALYEVSNATVHALMHIGCAAGGPPELAVYIKSRGLFTRLYMAAIWPARHAIIYPALTSRVENRWRDQAARFPEAHEAGSMTVRSLK
jgi:hypothetical protein